jgi:outer membrane protein TolC
LGANLGAESSQVNTLLQAPSLIWSIGINLAQIIYDGGKTESTIAAAKAAHEASVANYRATVLAAMGEVETTLRATRSLGETLKQQDSLVKTELEQTELIRKKQNDGVGTRYDIVIAEQSLIQAERTRSQLRGQRVLAAVFLVKALGGSWDTSQTTRKE